VISFIHNPEIRKAVKQIRFTAYSLVALMSLVLSLVMPAGVARAATVYDDAYQTVDSLTLGGTWPTGCSTDDLTHNWPQYLTNPTYRYLTDSTSVAQYNAQATSFAAARDHGIWAVSKQVSVGGGIYTDGAHIVWSEDPTATLTWATSPYQRVSLSRDNSDPSHGYIHDAYIGRRAGWGTAGGAPCDLVWGNPGAIYGTSTEISNEYGDRNDISTAGPQANLFVAMDNPTHPGGLDYEGELVRTVPPSAHYVALGDSFSSGEGNAPFEYGTANDGVNECHRSPQAYPRLLASDSSLNLGSTAFVACSGATTDNVLNGQWNEPGQVDALSEDTETVTITIGGNDIKFNGFASACLYGSCASSSSQYQESWDIMTDVARSDYLPSRLESLFSAISSHLWLNTNVKVYVVGYPYVMTHASWEDRGVGICSDFDEDEATAAEAIVLKLDTVINAAVSDFDDSLFVYVNPLATGSPFLGHELCRSGTYFHGTEAAPVGPAGVFHPNQDGQQAYADLIEGYMD
jgi:lysophospholipase L1-like esterase/membrane-bound inhibitor of C-type lysozyme